MVEKQNYIPDGRISSDKIRWNMSKWTKRLLVLAAIAIIINSILTLIMMIEIYKIAIATRDLFQLITKMIN